MKFKEGDLVRVIDVGDFKNIILNKLHIIDKIDRDTDMIYLKKEFNNPTNTGGWFSRRFKKIMTNDLTSKELMSYIKYKFKIGKVI